MLNKIYPLLSVTGLEIEYMLVHKHTLEIIPIADQVLRALSNSDIFESQVTFGNIGVCNELALHVLELKSLQPVEDLESLELEIYSVQQKIAKLLAERFDAVMLPTGAHPWLVPDNSISLWPHGCREIYNTFHRIFNCAGHGWVNLQSTHINLPFSNDVEFAQLHNAIRLLLPIIPALTASTPFIEGKLTGALDSRLTFYGSNQQQLPIISGQVIPEVILSCAEYHDTILTPMYRAIAPHDPDAILQHEWLNSRGAIARFDRSAIEIRIVDTQESLRQDIACASAIVAALHYITKRTDQYLHQPLDTTLLRGLYENSITHGMSKLVLPTEYVQQFGLPTGTTPGKLWNHLLSHESVPTTYESALNHIITHGNLAQRMVKYYQVNPSLPNLYQQLADLTNSNEHFHV